MVVVCLSFPFCPLQNGVHLPEDAVLGFGRGPFSSFTLCQAVPGTLPYAHWQYISTSTQVRRQEKQVFASRLYRRNNQWCSLRYEQVYSLYLPIFQLVLRIHISKSICMWCKLKKQGFLNYVINMLGLDITLWPLLYVMEKTVNHTFEGDQFWQKGVVWGEETGSEIEYRQSMKNIQLKR